MKRGDGATPRCNLFGEEKRDLKTAKGENFWIRKPMDGVILEFERFK
jgi:hypothetical protein